jgi:flagellar biosynthetic protein FliQ
MGPAPVSLSACPREKNDMSPEDAIDLARRAIWVAVLIGAPVLVTGMAVGLIVGLLQALTQIQEQTVAFVPKIVAMIAVLSLTLPWLIIQMLQYTDELITTIPQRF